jgi:hypothetical protein
MSTYWWSQRRVGAYISADDRWNNVALCAVPVE